MANRQKLSDSDKYLEHRAGVDLVVEGLQGREDHAGQPWVCVQLYMSKNAKRWWEGEGLVWEGVCRYVRQEGGGCDVCLICVKL